MVQFLPDATPVSLRLATRVGHGSIKFFHAIYVLARDTQTVISLDPRDLNLSVKDMRRRLHGLITPTTQSASIPLVYERARVRDYSPLYDTGTARSPTLDELRA